MAKSAPRPESLLAALPTELSQSLFAKARPLSLAAHQTLFVAGDEGDGCYRLEEGLLKASVAAATGGERILAILGPRSVVEAELRRPRRVRGIWAVKAGTLPAHHDLARAAVA